jgi:hypothetical protein
LNGGFRRASTTYRDYDEENQKKIVKAKMHDVLGYLSLHLPVTQATLSSVLPLTSHLDSPQIPSQEGGSGDFALTARQLQQSVKIVQSESFSQAASGSGAASGLASAVFGAASSGAVAVSGPALDSGAIVAGFVGEPPQAEISRAVMNQEVLRVMARNNTRNFNLFGFRILELRATTCNLGTPV